MKGIILAAGLGSRLKDITIDHPKALVRVNSIPLIDYALNFLVNVVDETIVIGGYRFDLLKAHLSGANLILLENNDYKKGSILTIKKALDYIDESFLLMNVDHIYPLHFIDKIANNIKGITGICDLDRKLVADDMKVKLNNGKIINIDKKLDDYNGGYIGITSCHKDYVPLYKSAVNETINTTDGSVNVEYVLQLLAKTGNYPNYLDLSGYQWLEIDNQNDLNKTNNIVKSNPSTFYL